jgi:hypothetical protein
MKPLLFSLISVQLLLSASCNRSNKDDQPENHSTVNISQNKDSAQSTNIAKKDSITHFTEDSINIKGPGFDLNGIQCYWIYFLHQKNRPDNPEYNLQLISMQLRSVDKDKIILNPAVSFDLQNDYHSAKDLLKYPQALLECKDINKDSWCDYEVLFERAAAGANTTSDAYLFNPANKNFEHSKLFSGTNVEYDSAKNMIKTFWKMGYGDYTYTYSYLKPNKKEISYVIEEDYNGDKVTISKIIKGKVVKKTTTAISE